MPNPFFTPSEWEALRKRATEPESSSRKPDTSRPIYLFGCGQIGQMAKPLFDEVKDLVVLGYLDNSPEKQGKTVLGWRVYSPDEAAPRILRENALVVITMYREDYCLGAEETCRRLGLPWVSWRDFFPSPKIVGDPLSAAEDPETIHGLDLWADEESRETYRNLIRYRLTRNPADMPRIFPRQYFIDELKPAMARDFVDCGAYIGDTLDEYKIWCKDDFASYHAFEPFANNIAALEKAAAGDCRVHIYPFAVSDRNGSTKIQRKHDNLDSGWDSGAYILPSTGNSNAMPETGEARIEVRRLDDVLEGKKVSCIKMDVEASEPAALRGGEGIIRRQRPVLAISVYHDISHLWSIPGWILALGLEYRLLLRHHTRTVWETVCYALPS